MENQYFLKEKLRYGSLKFILVISFLIIFFSKAECQESDEPLSTFKGGSYENTFSTVRIGLTQSVMVVPKGEFHLVVLHRFSEISGNVNEFFGLDYASTRLGFDYGVLNWLSASIGRSMSVQTYDFALKAVMLKQNDRNNPLSASWYLNFLENTSQGTEWAGHDSFGSRLSVVNQLILARNQGIFSFQASPMWLHSDYETRKDGPMDIFAVDLDARVRLTEMLGVIMEYIPIITNEEFTRTIPFTFGLDINTGHHQFQLIFSNSQGTNEKTILTNASGGHIYFGFNLTRIFNPVD
ncbi:MAG: DUF5777 family beta-barrel protein [Methanococcaceae archaeon]